MPLPSRRLISVWRWALPAPRLSKGAAVMILTDDNFATIVKAVEFGRGIYENLSNFIRFQMTNLVAYIVAYLGAAFFLITGGAVCAICRPVDQLPSR